eukprot:Opistho-2@50880
MAPRDVACPETTAGSATLSWTRPPEVYVIEEGYESRVEVVVNGYMLRVGSLEIALDDVQTTMATIDGLDPGTQYTASLACLCDGRRVDSNGTTAVFAEESNESDPVVFTTGVQEPAAAPINLRVCNASVNEIDLEWVPVETDGGGRSNGTLVLGYRILLNGDEYGTVEGTGVSMVTIGGLEPGTAYRFGVQAFVEEGCGAQPAAEVDGSTLHAVEDSAPAQPLLMPPTSIQASQEGPDGVNLSWVAVEGCDPAVDAYSVYLDGECVCTVDTISVFMQGLAPGHVYQLSVASLAGEAHSDPSQPIAFELTSDDATAEIVPSEDVVDEVEGDEGLTEDVDVEEDAHVTADTADSASEAKLSEVAETLASATIAEEEKERNETEVAAGPIVAPTATATTSATPTTSTTAVTKPLLESTLDAFCWHECVCVKRVSATALMAATSDGAGVG